VENIRQTIKVDWLTACDTLREGIGCIGYLSNPALQFENFPANEKKHE